MRRSVSSPAGRSGAGRRLPARSLIGPTRVRMLSPPTSNERWTVPRCPPPRADARPPAGSRRSPRRRSRHRSAIPPTIRRTTAWKSPTAAPRGRFARWCSQRAHRGSAIVPSPHDAILTHQAGQLPGRHSLAGRSSSSSSASCSALDRPAGDRGRVVAQPHLLDRVRAAVEPGILEAHAGGREAACGPTVTCRWSRVLARAHRAAPGRRCRGRAAGRSCRRDGLGGGRAPGPRDRRSRPARPGGARRGGAETPARRFPTGSRGPGSRAGRPPAGPRRAPEPGPRASSSRRAGTRAGPSTRGRAAPACSSGPSAVRAGRISGPSVSSAMRA